MHVRSSATPAVGHLYAITNKHVLDKGYCTLRLTKKQGGIDTIQSNRQDWRPHPHGWDVEVLPLNIGDSFQWWSIDTKMFISRDIIDRFNVGLGDEAFLIGRLVTHAGQQRNAPIVRFGNVSLMADPNEPIRLGKLDQESFLVECRSLSGFSGSPVFITTSQSYSEEAAERLVGQPKGGFTSGTSKIELRGMWGGTYGPWLLGIDCAHIPLWKPVFEWDHETKTSYLVEQNTGIAVVIPAWEIFSTLNDRELVKERKKRRP